MNLIAVVCLAASLPWLFANESRPLWGQKSIFLTNRIDNYFRAQSWTKYSYFSAASALNGLNCNHIGLEIGGDDYEYPLWVLMQKFPSPPRIEHMNVRNKSGNIPNDIFDPCAVIKSDKNKMLSVTWIDLTGTDLVTEAVPSGFTVEGMGEPEGPYPRWNLPRVRWAKSMDVRIKFLRNADNHVTLSMSFRPLTRDRAEMTVLLNDTLVAHYEVTNEKWHDEILDLLPQEGINLLEVRFDPLQEEKSLDESLYMLFRTFALETNAPDSRQ